MPASTPKWSIPESTLHTSRCPDADCWPFTSAAVSSHVRSATLFEPMAGRMMSLIRSQVSSRYRSDQASPLALTHFSASILTVSAVGSPSAPASSAAISSSMPDAIDHASTQFSARPAVRWVRLPASV